MTLRKPAPLADRWADQALDTLSDTARDLRQQVSPLLERAGEEAGALAQRGIDSVRDRALHLRDQARHASDDALSYIRDEPVKAMLIVAVSGAILAGLLGLWRKAG